jgi:hypothetical protein
LAAPFLDGLTLDTGITDLIHHFFLRPVKSLSVKLFSFYVTRINNLHGKLHDGVNDVTVVVLKSLDCHASGAAGLAHDQLDVLGIHASL